LTILEEHQLVTDEQMDRNTGRQHIQHQQSTVR